MVIVRAIRGEKEVLPQVPLQHLPLLLDSPEVYLWVEISGAMDDAAARVLREVFNFHPVAVEDCFAAREHPKIEGYDGYVYLITHGLSPGSTAEETEVVELDVFLGRRFLVTYHAKPSRSIAAVAETVERSGEPLRRGPALLLHAILDRQAENVEPVLDSIEERISALEDRVLGRPNNEDLATLLALRRNTVHLRRWMSKQRDIVLRLSRNEFGLIAPHETVLFRDVFDQWYRFSDLLENYRELTTSIQEAYLSVANTRLNEIMKFLTIFTAAFMPLTVITGIYGMNFELMPELRQTWGYPAVLAAMLVTSASVLWFFRRKGWLGRETATLVPRRTRTMMRVRG